MLEGISEGFAGQRLFILPAWLENGIYTDPVLSTIRVTRSGYFPHAENHKVEREQGCSQHVLIMVESGEGWVRSPNGKRSVSAGEMVLLPAGASHAYGAKDGDPWTIWWLHAAGSLATAIARRVGERNVVPSRRDEILAQFSTLLQLMEHCCSLDAMHYPAGIGAALCGLMLDRSQGYSGHSPDVASRMEKVLDRIAREPEKEFSTLELARMAGLSISRFNELFRRRTGTSPRQYLIRVRMNRACWLLDNTDLPVLEISASVGYADSLYFTRLFRQNFGVPPSEYRTGRT